ncbi:MAG: OmpA family protein [Candidatus Eisenbacteria bacterium]|uniref:OmpA family protein n=1 Tax=Eiseniibacteriota bacterium TaxID=2212470 RepID=A0A7Y2ECA1_UNCEI|nr:OmpA family protein [Candidatus Eisenbacteria bacterium]
MFVVLASLLGCGKAQVPINLEPYLVDHNRMQEEIETLSNDPSTLGFLRVAQDSMAASERYASLNLEEDARRTSIAALATNRVALASARAYQNELGADDCRQVASQMQREWQDAVAMLEQAERVAQRKARAVTREAPAKESAFNYDSVPDPDLTSTEALEHLHEVGDLLQLARKLRVPTSDLQAIWEREKQRATALEISAQKSDHHYVLAARAVQELEYRIISELAHRRCTEALQDARAFANYRDEALWAMVELERGMKETARAELETERSRMKDRQDELFDALKQFEGKFASISQEARGTIMSLKDILFQTGKADLSREAELNLVRVATILQQFEEMHIFIEGHTDNVGSEEYNQGLSERRAQSVLSFLAEQGVPLDNMDWFGYGMNRPVDSNATSEGRANNRRVDLVIGEQSEKGGQ